MVGDNQQRRAVVGAAGQRGDGDAADAAKGRVEAFAKQQRCRRFGEREAAVRALI